MVCVCGLCVVRVCGRIMVSLTLALTLVTLTLTLGGQLRGVRVCVRCVW